MTLSWPKEPGRLSELSSWIRATGGPWEEMDASLASLVPLWQWFHGFMADGLPGIPLGASLRQYVYTADDPATEGGKIGYAVETLGHYLMQACRRVDPAAAWVVDRRPSSMTSQRTGIGLSNKNIIFPSKFINRQNDDPDRLHQVATTWLNALVPQAQERQASILPPPQPTPDPPRRLWSPPTLQPGPPEVEPAPEPSGTVTDDPLAYLLGTDDALTILKGRDEDLKDPGRLAPLDGRLIDQHLRANGLHRAGTSTEDGLQIQTWVLDGDVLLASVDVVSVEAAVRYVYAHFEGDLHYRGPGFRQAATVFVTLAQQLGAGFLDDQLGILRHG